MLRLLLTCLAFLTGLIAIGAPANAMFAESSVSRSAAEISDPDQGDVRCECGTSIRLRDGRIACDTVCLLHDLRVFVPTVQLGPDRALE
ncbi:hypothetical protein AAG596_01280 [Citromicrobium bathyomarinum]|uniref:hypothetical protein n=1 Tax=Citromicrobium bathyomarinum TaxID=72174 RepID=UPI003159DEEF